MQCGDLLPLVLQRVLPKVKCVFLHAHDTVTIKTRGLTSASGLPNHKPHLCLNCQSPASLPPPPHPNILTRPTPGPAPGSCTAFSFQSLGQESWSELLTISEPRLAVKVCWGILCRDDSWVRWWGHWHLSLNSPTLETQMLRNIVFGVGCVYHKEILGV